MQIQIPPALFTPQSPAPAADAASDPLATARAGLLLPAGLDEDRVANVLGDVMGHAVDYADAYFQLIREESWALEDGIVKDGVHSIDHGVGVRALSEDGDPCVVRAVDGLELRGWGSLPTNSAARRCSSRSPRAQARCSGGASCASS
mgnify:CR=1 FL=1